MEVETTPTWQKNAPSQIVLDSIFAALAALWITIAVQPGPAGTPLWFKALEVICSLASFLLFAVSAEGATDACDEKDVIKYVYYLLWYNFGVIFIGAAIGLFLLPAIEPSSHYFCMRNQDGYLSPICTRFHSPSVELD